MADQDNTDVNESIKQALQRMLGRDLSPDVSQYLSPKAAAAQQDEPPFYLSKERNPDAMSSEEAPEEDNGPKIGEEDDNSEIENIAQKEKENNESEDEEAAPPIAAAPQQSQAAMPTINFGTPEQNQNGLAQALAQRNAAQQKNAHDTAIAQIAGGMARISPDQLMKNAQAYNAPVNQSVDDYMLKQKEQANDPKSGLAMGLRDYAKRLGVNIPEGATPAQIEQVMPMVYRDFEAKQLQASKAKDLAERLSERKEENAFRNKMLGLKAEELKTAKEQARQDKLNKEGQSQANKTFQQAEQLRGNPAIQQDMRTLQRVQNVKSIIAMYPDPNKIPPNLLTTFDADMATIISGGVPGEGLIHEVSSPTIQRSLAQTMQKYANQPVGARAAAFVKQYGKVFDTLANDAQTRLHDRYRRIGNTLGRTLPQEHKDSFKRQYLPNDVVDEKTGDFVPTQGSQGVPQGMTIAPPPDAQSKALAELKRRGIL